MSALVWSDAHVPSRSMLLEIQFLQKCDMIGRYGIGYCNNFYVALFVIYDL